MTQFQIWSRLNDDKHLDIVSWKLDQNCVYKRVHVFSKNRPYDLVSDPTCPNVGPGLDLIKINILTKFHKDCIKTVLSLHVHMVFTKFDLMA